MIPAAKTKAELQQQRIKLANSYAELLEEFSSKDLRHVGNYTLDKLIGKGSFGKVYLARHNLTNGTKVVLKSSRKDDGNLAREIHHHRQFLHPHIARLYEVIVTETLVWLALEYCPGDELYNYLLQNGALPVPKVQRIFAQLVGAVAYIHNKSCVHRDLKLENVLLDKNENVKLCDFGFTREYEGKANYLQTFCGTVCYSAPEMLKGEKYAGEKVDVWSLGIILYALLRGELPFDEDDDELTKAKIIKEEPHFPEGFPEDAKALISKLLSKRPLHRPTLSDILADPFISEHAPQQQVILKLSQPAPFTTPLEKATLERMKSAGVDIDRVIENVLSQRCDNLAGWWALLIEKEERKELRRERKRKEREAEIKLLRRLSGASGRFDKFPSTLYDVNEEGHPRSIDDKPRSSSRGRKQRRSTPQILVTDLPQLPEGSAIVSPASATPPPPLDKDSVRSPSTSRPPPPPKERKRRSSTLQIVMNNPELLTPPGGIHQRPTTKKQHAFLNQLASLKHWLVESAKRARSPGKALSDASGSKNGSPKLTNVANGRPLPTPLQSHHRDTSQTTAGTRSSYGAALTPTTSHQLATAATAGTAIQPTLETTRTRRHRNSLSPSPLTPHSGYGRGSGGLRGRKSTSSSVSSVRSMPRYQTHSKASSTSSNSIEHLHSPGSKSAGRSPHSSIKVLPATPTTNSHLLSTIKFAKGSTGLETDRTTLPAVSDESSAPMIPAPSTGLVYARRKKSPFKGPMLNGALFGLNVGSGQASPMVRAREGSAGRLNLGLHDLNRNVSGGPISKTAQQQRKSQIIEEEEEDEDNEEAIEEVDAFDPVDLARGERVHSITLWNEEVTQDGVVGHEDEEELRK